ncbi:MAG: SurA N-terminal domain-containing protein [Bacteroidetes bacterium]|nr:SurA N-terminal domain-containing protein [Bacteroidota bacterium]
MSAIQKIRDKAGWIVFGAIALALIAFILQDAFTQSNRGGGLFSNSTNVAKVNGIAIPQKEFENNLQMYQQMNGAQREDLMGNVYDFMVNQEIMQQQYDKLGLKISDNELSSVLFGNNPPQEIRQAFTDPKTGEYNVEAAKQQFAMFKKNANDPRVAQIYEYYLKPIIQQLLAQKYQALISQAVYIPKWMAEKTNADNNSMAKISFVSFPYNSLSDSAVKVSDEEILAYAQKHEKLYTQKEETREIQYISYSMAPSPDDSAQIRQKLLDLKNEFIQDNDPKGFLNSKGTEMPYYDAFVHGSQIQQQDKDSLLSIPTGGTFGPYISGQNYVIAKMVNKSVLPDSVKVRHILVATHQNQNNQLIPVRDDSSALHRLDSAIALIKGGVGFDSVCNIYSDDPGSKEKGGVIDYFTTGSMMPEFSDFAFTGKVGETKIVQTDYGYHYMEILGQKGSSQAYKIAYLAKPIVASQETLDAVNNQANQFAATCKNDEQFMANAKKINKTIGTIPGIKENDFALGKLGTNRTLIKWIYANKVGNVSEPLQVGDNYIVAIISSIDKPGLMGISTLKPMVMPILINEKKAKMIIDSKIKGTTLEQIAQSGGTQVQMVDSISFQAMFVPILGNEVKVIGAAFNKSLQNKVSIPIAGNNGVFVLKGESIYAVPSLGGSIEALRNQLGNNLKQEEMNSTMASLKDAADIKDYRSDFY